ncbi:tripartite motif-containing protein 59 [Phyllopteryx taeniolatus]|uniref:tripartite motif-containing protein 59 n=1 Tax=Phyllopteryx taeniolatus TaxID=161469 RepID=UPI002AD36629|nr:tripartite motif-containing protein 59 [Phyllopteryx taeniolatus]
MDSLEEDLTCSVCYSLFSDPRVLPCSHTFCRACLHGLLLASHNYSIWRPLRQPLKCPNCRGVVELPVAGVDALPTNVSLRAIIEKYQGDSEPRAPLCPEHPRQPLNMYCVRDRRLICGLCLTVGQHQGHAIDDLQTAFAREKQTPSLLLARLSEHRWAQVCELGEQLEQEKARCEGLLRQDRQEVAQFFHMLEAALARKRQAYLEVLDKALAEVSRAYDPLIHRVKELQEEQLDLVSLAASVEEEDSPLVFLEKVHMFKERVDDFTSASLPSALNLSVTPRAADYLHRHWAAVTLGSLDEAPVPKVCCCARCGSAAAKAHEGPSQDSYRLRAQLLLLLLLLLLFLLSSLCWLGVAQFNRGLREELFTPIWDWMESSYTVTEVFVLRWSSHVFSTVEMFLQQLTAFFITLTSPLDPCLLFTS